MHTINDKKLLMLKPCDIEVTKVPVRSRIDDYELRLLADSISANGIIEPVTVRKNENGKYELITGFRRLKAAKIAGLRRMPCVLHRIDSVDAAFFAVAENLQQSRLNIFEQAIAIERLIRSFSLPVSEVAARLGISQAALLKRLEFLKLSVPLRERILAAGLSEGYIKILLKLPEELRESSLNKIIADDLSKKQAEEYIYNLLYPKKETVKQEIPTRKSAIGDPRLFGNSLSKLIETLRNSGVNATSRKFENDKYIEYKVRIKKEPPQEAMATQLKIC